MRDLCQHVMDLVENSVASGAQRVTVLLSEDVQQNRLSLLVEDDGEGMTPEVAGKAADPFYTTRNTRRVGLGLSLLQAASQRSEGSFALDSAPGRGTRVECSFGLTHLDRPPWSRCTRASTSATNTGQENAALWLTPRDSRLS